MPYPYTDAAASDDTDPAIPDGPTGSAATWKKLLDARAFATLSLFAGFDWTEEYEVTGSAPNNFTITIGAISHITLYNGTTYKSFSYGGGSITQTKVEGGGGTLGAAEGWWYIYAYNNAGSLDWEISQTAPLAARKVKSSSSQKRYIGAFRADTNGIPMAMRMVRGRAMFRTQQQVATGLVATTPTSVIVRPSGTTESPLLPPHARVAILDFRFKRGTDASTKAANIYGAGSSSHVNLEITGEDLGGVSYTRQVVADVETDSSRQFMYALSSATGTAQLEAFSRGWLE